MRQFQATTGIDDNYESVNGEGSGTESPIFNNMEDLTVWVLENETSTGWTSYYSRNEDGGEWEMM